MVCPLRILVTNWSVCDLLMPSAKYCKLFHVTALACFSPWPTEQARETHPALKADKN